MGYETCSTKWRRCAPTESPSTSQGSVVTAFSVAGATDTFHDRSNSAYKAWLQAVHPADVSHEYAAFFNEKVAAYEQGVWTTGQVQCQYQGILPSMTRMVPADSIPPNKSQPFSIVWTDDTDSVCDLSCLLTYVDNFVNNRHKADATRTLTTNRSARRTSNGSAAPSSLPSPSSLPRSPFPPRDAPAASPAHTAGIFAGIPSRSGDLVDNLTSCTHPRLRCAVPPGIAVSMYSPWQSQTDH